MSGIVSAYPSDTSEVHAHVRKMAKCPAWTARCISYVTERWRTPRGSSTGDCRAFTCRNCGQKQAEAAADRLADRDIAAVMSSPMERAQETAEAIAARHGLEVGTDDRLLESHSTLEGIGRSGVTSSRNPKHWWQFRNPLKPSWGESFSEIRARMMEAITELLAAHEGREVVAVSHQTPVQVARLAIARRNVPPWLGLAPCGTGSVTTLVVEGERLVSLEYYAPPG